MGPSSEPNKTNPRRPRKPKRICLPFLSENHYHTCMTDRATCRQYILEQDQAHPELCSRQP